MRDPSFAKLVVFINALVPLSLLLWDARAGQLGTNGVETVIHTTGMMTLVFLMLTLAITPLRKITGWNWLSHFRRMLGLFAFFYGLLHFYSYLWLDQSFDVMATARDMLQHRFIFFGVAGLYLMFPLAITSTNWAVKFMGAKRWKRLHKLVYLSAIFGVLHFYEQGKIVTPLKMAFVITLALLLGYRLAESQFSALRKKPPSPASVSQS